VCCEVAAVVITLMMLGRRLKSRTRGQASGAIRKLIGLQMKIARVVRGGETLDISLELVQVGDTVVMRPGEKIPVDGQVLIFSGLRSRATWCWRCLPPLAC
jgi:Cu+-exporting ATPase